MQDKTKKIIIIALSAVLVLVIARRVYRRFCMPAKEIVITGQEDKRYQVGLPLSYDYTRLIGIIEKTIELKKSFYQQFFSETTAHKSVGRKEVRELLADLYREKVRLVKFDRQMRIRFKGDVPPKRKRTVKHYQRIVDKCISDMEQILRQL